MSVLERRLKRANPLDLLELDLSQNLLRDLDVLTFKQMFNLKSLDLYKNNIVTLQTHVFDDLTELESLVLSMNQITAIDGQLFSSLIISRAEFFN